ncbi:MAG: GNAT family N-acetyltransferase [Bacteroidia bacterium]|nr:GNAT family N-acetyltransferase [Bacteroidia bacterium]NND12156.1 GNAT family N-acetyltransferase [Flavobacteriaceae bacterium]MBT8309199.1 GNAT family N-acetyltransferase [Bacteroidia bacterium]NNK27289.1 GNAT family N-acetyltransferase [Flavobacteriaceae bacterium]NNL61514.1 GNAT family N-acetyltransferase [Flavobacteriaceae bacterium]
MKIVSVRENPDYKEKAIAYFQKSWESVLPVIYEDSITHCINARDSLPQWYLLEKNEAIIGCAGLITNDFISRGDLYPWVCAIFVEEAQRGNAFGSLLMEKAKTDAKNAGFHYLYLCTSHIGYYEKYGFTYIGQGYHPWGEASRIYEIKLI